MKPNLIRLKRVAAMISQTFQISTTLDAVLKRIAKRDRMGWSAPAICLSSPALVVTIIPYILIRHRVADFSKWKPAYEAHLSSRQEAGLREVHLLRNVDDPSEVILFWKPKICNARRILPPHQICVKGCKRLE